MRELYILNNVNLMMAPINPAPKAKPKKNFGRVPTTN
jgi:hypothetical protein